MSLTLGSSAILLVLLLLAAGAFAFWSYLRTTPPIKPAMRALLGGLRFTSLALILFLLFDPSIRRSDVREHEPELVFFVDNSASVPFVQGDEGDGVVAALDGLPGRILSMPLRTFDTEVRPGGTVAKSPDSLTFQGSRTNIAAAIDDLRLRPGPGVRGAILISDGRYNTGRSPLFAADETPVPVHTVIVGDTSAYVDVVLREVVTNEIAQTGTELPIRARIVADGFAGRRVAVTVLDGPRTLAEEALELRGDGTEQTVDLYVTPEEAGMRRFTVRVTELEGEVTHRNNVRTVTVRVVDSRRQILIIGGAPDPDIGALRQSLSSDGDIEITTRMQRSGDAFYEGALPSDFNAFDLVILAGFPSAGTPSSVIRTVSERIVAGRRPSLVLAGRSVNVEGLRALSDDVIIAMPTGGTMTRLETTVDVTASGRSHPVSGTVVADHGVWSRLPPLLAFDAGWQPSADATVLVESATRGGAFPILTVRSRGGVRRAALLGTDSWRWRTVSPTISGADVLYDRLIENLVRWLASPEDTRRVRVRPVQDLFEGNETVRMTGEVYDESLAPLEDADVEIEITPAEGPSYRLPMTRDGAGRFRLDAGVLPEGSYEYRATARRGDAPIGTDRGVFAVGALEREFLHPRADATTMRQIAARTGGRSVMLDDLGALVADLIESPAFEPEREHIVREASLRHTFLLLIGIVLLLAAEWILRKRSGMV